jgi:ectoine hydroxylase
MSEISGQGARAAFWRRGFIVMRSVFKPAEMGFVREAIVKNGSMTLVAERARRKYAAGKYPSFETLLVWNDTSGNDIFAKVTRAQKLWQVLTDIFDDEIYVYHNKVALKYPGVPGFKYHQDYYYWYGMGCLYPDMGACFIAIDPATRANGCLKVLEGSHRLGRLEHELSDGVSDSGVAKERLAILLQRLPEIHLELNPGDCAIFHCNTLHGSDPNLSDEPRLALLGCYNTKHNDPYIQVNGHPNFCRQYAVIEPIVSADVDRLPRFVDS